MFQSALSVSAQTKCHVIRVFSFVTQFVNFDLETLVFLGYVLSENDPSIELNNNLVYGGTSMFVLHFRHLLVICEVQKAKNVKISVPWHSVTIERCVEIVSP